MDGSTSLPAMSVTGTPLAPWTYHSTELLDLEYEHFFLRRWQFTGHVSEVAEEGAYLTHDLGRDNIIVLRGKDNVLRAFQNVCRHRASRLLEGRGECRGAVRCRYHGWTYSLDGTLKGIPAEENFPGVNKAELGLRPVDLEVFHGLIFVRVIGGGPSVAQLFGATEKYFEGHGVTNYEPFGVAIEETWDVNWKVAWDNYLENYHIPVGHPGLQRLLVETDEAVELAGGVSLGVFEMRETLSNVPAEREYQQQIHHTNYRLPPQLHGKWVQFGLSPNLGIDLYPELLDLFQLTPLGPRQTRVRMSYFAHRNPTDNDQLLRRLNLEINQPVNDEDRALCERVQYGVGTTGYLPGPLSLQESSVHYFHQMIRDTIPVSGRSSAPAEGTLNQLNQRLLDNSN